MLGLSFNAARYAWTSALVLLSLYVVFMIRSTLFILTISILFAYLLYPLVDFLNGHLPSRSRTPALAIVYLALVGLLIFLGVEVGSQAAEQAASLSQRAPEFLEKLKTPPSSAGSLPGAVASLQQTVIGTIENYVSKHYNEFVAFLPKITLEVLRASTGLIYLVIIPVLSFFILKDGRMMRDELVSLIETGTNRRLVRDILADVHVMLLQYMRALVTLCGITFVTVAIVLSAMSVPYALLLASIAFPLEFIPLVGPLVAAVVIISVTALTGGHVLWVVAFLGAYRVMQDYIISPRLMSSGVELHPLFVILGVFAGGEIAGIEGTFLSIPTLALMRAVYHRVQIWQSARRADALTT